MQDGYLLTARGKPMPKVVRDGDAVVVHCSGGKDLPLKPLKMIQQAKGLSQAGHIAMEVVQPHIRKIECYTCHTSWSPQCYGCHVRIDPRFVASRHRRRRQDPHPRPPL